MKAAFASITTLGLIIGGALVLRAVMTPRPVLLAAPAQVPALSPGGTKQAANAIPTSADMSGWAAGSSVD